VVFAGLLWINLSVSLDVDYASTDTKRHKRKKPIFTIEILVEQQ
jgi:hypothetical protein